MVDKFPPTGLHNSYKLSVRLTNPYQLKEINMPITSFQQAAEIPAALLVGTVSPTTEGLETPTKLPSRIPSSAIKVVEAYDGRSHGPAQSRSPEIYPGPYPKIRKMKFTRRNEHFYWYTVKGSAALEVPPPSPDSLKVEDVASVFINCLPNSYQHWWRSGSAAEWEVLDYGATRTFHDEIYHFIVTPSGDASWVKPATYKQRIREESRSQPIRAHS